MLGASRFLTLARACARSAVPWLLGAALWAAPAAALERSELEQRMVTRALGASPALVEAPEGQLIESVEIVRLRVFDDDDPVPDFVNVLHAQSREHTIRRELLFRAGERYDSARVEETIRVLQLIPQFGVIVIVAVAGSEPGRVKVVVIVRDVWSLRANYRLDGSSRNFDYFLLNLSEDNLLGTLTRAGVVFTLQPDRYSLGGLLAHPRVRASRVDAYATFGVYQNRETHEAEGSYGTVYLRQALARVEDRWGFLAGARWRVEHTRLFQGGQPVLWAREPREAQGPTIPVQFATRIVRAGAELTRAFGREQRYFLSVGLELSRRSFRASRREQDSARDFADFVRDEVPVSDTRLSPFVQLEHRTSRFLRTRDVETLALEEQFSLGQQAALRVYPAAAGAGSSRTLLGTASWAGYTWQLGDGFARAIAGSNVEYERHGRHQASAQGAVRVVSPRLGFVRLVFDAAAVTIHENYLNDYVPLGGDVRPRGYLSSYFRGDTGYAGTLELRTSSVNILSARVGGVAFYDVGGAGGGDRPPPRPNQALGAGVRILFPQVNRQVFRLDWAAPFTAGPQRAGDSPLPGAIYFSFEQAFDVPKLRLPEMLGTPTTLLEREPR